MTRRTVVPLVLLAMGGLMSGTATAQPAVDGAVATQVSEEITRQLGRGEIDTALRTIAVAMKSEAVAQSLKGSLQAIKGFGKNQYADRV